MMAIALVLSLLAVDPNAGTVGFDFLRVVPTAREAALGGATAGLGEGPMAPWYNPAHAVLAGGPRAQLSYNGYVAGIHIGSAAYAQSVGPDRGVGLSVVYLNSGTMKRTDPQGNEQGTYGASYADVSFNGAMRAGGLFTVGAGLQGLYGSIDTFFTIALAGNVGATFEVPVEELTGLTIGASARNVGYQVKAFQEGRDPMPVEFTVGLGYSPNASVNVMLDVAKPLDNRILVRGGIEGWVADLLVLRAGYNSLGQDLKSGGGEDILAGVSAGLGIRYRGYQVDYCFVPMVELGPTHRFSLSLDL